ncbi:thiosulfate oxidation carrier complex protein SoxZ [Thiomicrospira microaerophila]|uniref:thiosulfate oxidation carrier complex protein SoxZ n=1 Tax=Thiomicrospira microaerophila TaxID=406020 RepID=UPI00200D8266|nr:thiosulfate oxidation carrier complex protein SoxZ [Thiomicrospira microaerophila]UQB41831.1 thiosulfate oxidation carrier complex protein SoxZ [Thiomicrospira microaerophila]
MSINIRTRGQVRGGVAEIKSLIRHPMESGARMDQSTGKPFPMKLITNVDVSVNGNKVVDAQWSANISTNPYMHVNVAANSGDEVTINLVDNTGETGSETFKLR